jgi:hypothetical protein
MLHSRIQPVSRRFSGLCSTLIVILPVVVAAYWLLMPAEQLASQWAGKPDAVAAVSLAKRLVGFALMLVGLLPLGFCLIALRRLFRLYATGTIFGTGNVAAFNAIGIGLIGFGIVQLLAPTVMGLVLTIDNPVGHRLLVLGLDAGSVESLILGAIVRLIGWVMDEAREMADEQAQTV